MEPAETVEIVGEVRFPGTYPDQARRDAALGHAARRRPHRPRIPGGQHFPARGPRARRSRSASSSSPRGCRATSPRSRCRRARTIRAPPGVTIGPVAARRPAERQAGRPARVRPRSGASATSAGHPATSMMKGGDRILVPRRAQEVTVLGEVQTNTSHLFRPGLMRDDYIALSGGTTQRADTSRTYVVRADGSVVTSGSALVRPRRARKSGRATRSSCRSTRSACGRCRCGSP